MRCTISHVIARTWRHRPGLILVLYMVLEWLPFVADRLTGDVLGSPLRHALGLSALLAVLGLFVWRGSTIAWAMMWVISVLSLGVTVLAAAAPWNFSICCLIALGAAQVVLLFSPAIWNGLAFRRSRSA